MLVEIDGSEHWRIVSRAGVYRAFAKRSDPATQPRESSESDSHLGLGSSTLVTTKKL